MRKEFKSMLMASVVTACAPALVACGGEDGTASSITPSVQSTQIVTTPSSTSSNSSSSVSSSSSSSSSDSSTDSASGPSADVPPGYSLAWSDEFNGAGLPDASKWVDDSLANTYDPENGELEYYTARNTANEHMDGGYLYITALKQDFDGQPNYAGQHYSSARITTLGKKSWLYGYFEVRAKLPCGAGTWPAIWTLGTTGSWPSGGELDIAEEIGRVPNTIVATVHDSANQGQNGNAATTIVPTACGAFHRYEMLWTASSIQIGVDGVKYLTYNNDNMGSSQWPFSSPQYLLLNLALGGSWAGPVDELALPQSLVVDYVRVYQKS